MGRSFAKLCMNFPDALNPENHVEVERERWHHDSWHQPLDCIMASRLNLSLSRATTPRNKFQEGQTLPVAIFPRPKTPIASPRRRPYHGIKGHSELESVMQERHNRERVHGRVMLDPFDPKLTRARK